MSRTHRPYFSAPPRPGLNTSIAVERCSEPTRLELIAREISVDPDRLREYLRSQVARRRVRHLPSRDQLAQLEVAA